MFPYENKNKYTKNAGYPSSCTYKDLKNFTQDTLAETYDDYSESDKYREIVEVVGLANKRVDILHLDSAYKSRCKIFLTNDKDDIWSHKLKLEELLALRIFCIAELDECLGYILSINTSKLQEVVARVTSKFLSFAQPKERNQRKGYPYHFIPALLTISSSANRKLA